MIEQTAFTGRWADARAGGPGASPRRRRARRGGAAAHYAPLMRYIIAPIVPDAQDREGVPFRRRAARGRNSEPTIPRAARGRHGSRRSRATPRSTARGKSPAAARSFRATCPPPSRRPRSGFAAGAPTGARARADRAAAAGPAALYRKYYYRQSTAQIAAELGTTERAVEGRLYRIKKALRKALGGDDA